MLAFDPRSGEVRGFDLCQGDVFEVGSHPFLVTRPAGGGPLSVVGECGRVRSVDECEAVWRARGVVPETARRIGVWRGES